MQIYVGGIPARETIENSEDRWSLLWIESPTLMHEDVDPIRTVFGSAEWTIVSLIRQNL